MHEIQEKLLLLSKKHNLEDLSLREMADKIGLPKESPQKIKHHLTQLEKKGFFRLRKYKNCVEKTPNWAENLLKKGAKLLSIPIIGTANCGPANIYAETNYQGFLKVSSNLLGKRNASGLFAVKADGSSMNRAEIKGKKIEDGDRVIIDSSIRSPQDNDVVLAIVDGRATIKRFIKDDTNKQIVLMADSSFDYEPIYLHESDSFNISGKVVDIIKKPVRVQVGN